MDKARIALTRGTKEDKLHLKNMLIQSRLAEESARKAALKSKERKTPGVE
jgi:hypothetical protein